MGTKFSPVYATLIIEYLEPQEKLMTLTFSTCSQDFYTTVLFLGQNLKKTNRDYQGPGRKPRGRVFLWCDSFIL